MVKLRTMHLNAYKQAVQKSGLPDLEELCQLREVEAIEASMHPDIWKSRKYKFNEWKAAFPTESGAWTLYEGREAAEVCVLV